MDRQLDEVARSFNLGKDRGFKILDMKKPGKS
jgi:hypothetical protein